MLLLKTHTLTFTSQSGGFYNDDGEWTDGTLTKTVLKGSLQSMSSASRLKKTGLSTNAFPDSYSTTDVKGFYTQQDADVLDEFSNTVPSTTVIDGKSYKVWAKSSNTGFGLMSDHTLIILIRELKSNAGGW